MNEPDVSIRLPDEHPAVSVLNEAADVMRRKAKDYTREDTDAFDNFREVARATGLTVDDVIRVHIANKQARLNNLFSRGGRAQFEPIEDTLLDLVNYAALLSAWLRQR